MYTVFIRALEVYAYHGVPPEERVVGHRYLVDLELAVDGAAPETDRVEDTVDYGAVAKLVEGLLRDGACQTVERLAGIVCEEIFAKFEAVEEITVSIEKPLPPMPVIAEAAGVRLTRSR